MKLLKALALATSLSIAVPAGAVVLLLSPAETVDAVAGEMVDVDVLVSDLGDEIVSAFDLDVLFDAAVLSPVAVAFSDELGVGDLVFNDSALLAGRVSLAAVSLQTDDALGAAQDDDVTLATLSFEALASATTSLTFDFGPGKDIKGANNRVIVPTVTVPEPATLGALALGLAGLLGAGRRRWGIFGGCD